LARKYFTFFTKQKKIRIIYFNFLEFLRKGNISRQNSPDLKRTVKNPNCMPCKLYLSRRGKDMRMLISRDTFPAHVLAQKVGHVKIQSADSVWNILILLKDLTMASSDDDCIDDDIFLLDLGLGLSRRLRRRARKPKRWHVRPYYSVWMEGIFETYRNCATTLSCSKRPFGWPLTNLTNCCTCEKAWSPRGTRVQTTEFLKRSVSILR